MRLQLSKEAQARLRAIKTDIGYQSKRGLTEVVEFLIEQHESGVVINKLANLIEEKIQKMVDTRQTLERATKRR